MTVPKMPTTWPMPGRWTIPTIGWHSCILVAATNIPIFPIRRLPRARKFCSSIPPNDPTVLASLIPTLHALHQDKEAENYHQRLKDRQPKVNRLQQLRTELIENQNDVELRFQVGALNLELGREEEAAHWFQTVLWIDPYHQPTLRALANYWRKRGDLSRAAYYSTWAEGKL